MTPLLSIILLFLISYLGWLLYNRFSSQSALLNHIYVSGSLYMVIGFLIGPKLIGLINQGIISELNVLVGLVLGWTGFLIGLQAKRHELKRFQEGYYLFATVNFLFMLVGSASLLILFSTILELEFKFSNLTILAIAGTVSSPILIAVMRKEYKVRGQSIHLLQFSAAYDNMLGVFIFGIVLIFFNPILGLNILTLLSLVLSVSFSAVMAYLFFIISKRVSSEQQFFLLLVGFLLVIVGVAMNVNISLICTSFFFGVVLTNLPLATKNLYHSIAQVEKPLYYLMLIFVGASIYSVTLDAIYLVILFIIIRFLLKLSSGFAARLSIIPQERPIKTIGLPHLGMGGLAVAMILDYHVSYPTELSQSLLFAIAFSMIITTLASPRIFKLTLKS